MVASREVLSVVLLTLVSRPCRAWAPRELSSDAAPEQSVLKIRDDGHRFQVGELYDARIDQRVSGRLYSAELLGNYTYETPAWWSFTDVAVSDSIREKRRLMGISAEAALKDQLYFDFLNNGGFELQSSGRYLVDQRRTESTVRMATGFQTRTVKEKLDIFANEMLSDLNQYPLGEHPSCVGSKDACRKATHVVTSITWGADVFVTFENSYLSDSDKARLELYLRAKIGIPINYKMKARGLKLVIPNGETGISIGGGFVLDESEYERFNTTKVTTFGDVAFKRPLPTTIDEALDFVKSLPEETDTIVGQGVPMEVELTPLAWLHSDAAKLVQRINEDTIERLTNIYEDFQTSDARISDMVTTDYAGFISWKASADAFHNDFRIFRSNYSSSLAKAMRQFQGGLVNQDVIDQLEMDYLQSPFTAPRVQAEVEAKLDVLNNLLASVATMESAGVTFANSLSDFFGPTFDSRFDRVYGLILVGPSPASNRKGITNIRDFAQLAKARKIKDAVPEHPDVVKHCVETIDVGRNETRAKCKENLGFVAVDFESFCTAFCPVEFCKLDPAGNQVCPATENSTPPCELSAEDAEVLRCDVNDHVGKCGADPFHDPENYQKNPTGHCWCACPQTILMSWFHSQPARGLREDFPRRPGPPQLQDPPITGHDVPEQLPYRQVMYLKLNTSHHEGAYNYRVTISWKEQVEEGALTYFVDKQQEVETPGRRPTITLRGLVAGREYRIEVSPVNSQGVGEPVVVPGWYKVAHRMATVVFPTNNQYEHQHNTGPSWYDVRVQIQLSTQSYDEISMVTVHRGNEDCQNVDVITYEDSQNDPPIIMALDCTGASATSISCVLPFSQLSPVPAPGEELELRVWDLGHILAAISPISLVEPSATTCPRYGSSKLFCPFSSGCVRSCSECSVDSLADGSTCKEVKCEARQLWCPARESCINRTHSSFDAACLHWCTDADGTGADYVSFASSATDTCVSGCNLTLPDGYPQGVVRRGATVSIDCVEPYFRIRGLPLNFTCPSLDEMERTETRADAAWHFDEDLVLRHSDGATFPPCGRCSDDEIFDREARRCRSPRSEAPVWNYVRNSDLEEYNPDGLPTHFVVTGGGVSQKDTGVNGFGHALQFQPGVGAQAVLSQTLSLSLLKPNEVVVPPLGSEWKASLLYKMLSSGGVSGSRLGQVCLRDREPRETPARQCFDLQIIEGSMAWHRAELRLTVQAGAELLALDVVAESGHFAVDHLRVGPISGFEEQALSPHDIAEEAVKVALAEVKPMIALKGDQSMVDDLQDAFERRLREEGTLEEEIKSHHDQIQELQRDKASKSQCRVCVEQTAWLDGCSQCNCGRFCSGWADIGSGYDVGSRMPQLIDDTHGAKRGGCLREFWLECRDSR